MVRVALTFDDGPGPSTSELLDVLRDAGAHATFFVLGRNVDEAAWCGGDAPRARALVVRALCEGHVVGSHTYSHAQPDAYLSLAQDLRRNDELIRRCRADAGLADNAPIAVRLPYGIKLVGQTFAVSTGTLAGMTLDPRLPVLASLGRTHVHWTSDFEDWTTPTDDGPALCDRMLAHVERLAHLGLDAVLDLHDGGTGSRWGFARDATVCACRRFLEEARRRTWTSFTVPSSGVS